MTLFTRLSLILTCAMIAATSANAQSMPAAPAPAGVAVPTVAPSRTATRTVNATVVAVNSPARTVSLRLAPDNTLSQTPAEMVVAVQDATCRPLKNNRVATLAEFIPGEPVIARLTWRVAPERVVVLRDLYDTPSYTERQRQGKEICVGVVDAFTATELTVRRGDGRIIAFRVTDKTRLIKNDAPAALAAFPTGSPVAVKPRRLPGGDLQASFVGENAREVAWAYRDTLTTWSGSVTTIQGDERNGAVVSLYREDGAQRQFLLSVGAKFKQGRSELPWRLLPGATVSAHLIKATGREGMRHADGVKIVTTRTRKLTEDAVEKP